MSGQSRARHLVAAAAVSGFLVLCLGGAAASPAASAATDDHAGPRFYSGVSIDVSGPVDGDVYAAGQSVVIDGEVRGDVIAAAQTITINGTVDGNVRLAAQDVTINGRVARSGTVFSSSLVVAAPGSVGDDIVAAASSIRITGTVGRDVTASAADLTIDGTVGGDLTYSSSDRARIDQGAVDGTVHHIVPQQSPRVEISPWAAAVAWFLGLLYALVALSLITVLAGVLVPRVLQRVTDHLLPSPWRALLVGFVAAIAVPVALLFVLVTVIGAPLALAGMLIWFGMTLATFVFGAHYLGRLVLRDRHHPTLTSLVGGLILIVGLQIPWLNILVWLAMVFFGLGAQLLELRRQRPWRSGPAPVPTAAGEASSFGEAHPVTPVID